MSELRFDTVPITIPKTSITKDGYVKGEAIVTRVGVFEYVNKDGSIRRELRHPSEVFKQDSLDSMKMLPITNDHPGSLVNVDNAKELSIGMIGESIRIDSDSFIVASYNITDKKAIKDIQQGKRSLSMGYKTNVIQEDGVYEGESYTHRQTDIEYNHLAVVEKGRAGKEAMIHLDHALFEHEKLTTKEIKKMNEDEANTLTARNDQLEKELFLAEKMQKNLKEDLDKLQARYDQALVEIEELKKVRVDSLINEKAKVRLDLLNKASKILNTDSGLDDLSDREIREKVIVAHDSAINVKEKSDDYIAARFDTIFEFHKDTSAIKNQMKNLDVAPNAFMASQNRHQRTSELLNKGKHNA